MTEGKRGAVIFQKILPMDLKLISSIRCEENEAVSEDSSEVEIDEDMLDRMKEGYMFMGKLNIELSEIGLSQDYYELVKYEGSLLRKGIF